MTQPTTIKLKGSRFDGRNQNEIRKVTIEPNVNAYAEGSCMVSFGNTKVLCTASVNDNVPRWLNGAKQGWITAEYGMLPRSTHDRMNREAVRGKQSGRTLEISRLIGRTMRTMVDLTALGKRTITLDCDVIQADGGTRTASVTGAFVALHLALQKLVAEGEIKTLPVTEYVAAVSCGMSDSGTLLDLNYHEDSSALADANFVMTESGKIIEVQATAEQKAFTQTELTEMTRLAWDAIQSLISVQKSATEKNNV